MSKNLTHTDFDLHCRWFKCPECNSFQRWKMARGGGILCYGCGTVYSVHDDMIDSRIALLGRVVSREDRFRTFSLHIGNEWFTASYLGNYFHFGSSEASRTLSEWASEGKIEVIQRTETKEGRFKGGRGKLYRIKSNDNE